MARLKTLKHGLTLLPNRLSSLPPPSKASDYRIRGRTLQGIRERHFNAHPLCVMCKAQGLVTPATELDHIIPLSKGGTDTDDNRAGLCHECHKVKTAEDLGVRI